MSVTLKLNLFNIAKLNILSTKPTNTSTPLIKHNANNVIKHFTLITNLQCIKTVIRDILKDVKSMAVKTHAVSKVIVPTRTRSRLNVKKEIC